MFRINPSKAYFAYLAAKETVNKDFIEFASQVEEVKSYIHFDILTEYGYSELDFIVVYISLNFKGRCI